MDPRLAPSKQRSWKTPAIVLIVGVLLLLTFLWIYDSIGAAALSRAIAQARAIGGPLTLEEAIAARRSWPNDRNGANVILSIETNLDQLSRDQELTKGVPVFDTDCLPELGRRWSAETGRQVEKLLAGSSNELAVIDTLQNFEGGRFPLHLAPNLIDTLLPHLAPLRTSCRLKSLQVLHRAMQGDTSRLSADLEIMLAHGRLLADEPLLISMLVARACDAQSLRALERTLAITTPADSQLQRIQPLLTNTDSDERIEAGIRGERAFFIAAADYLRKTGIVPGGGGSGIPAFARIPGAAGWLMQSEAHGIILFNRMLQAPGTSGLLRESKAIERERNRGGSLGIVTDTLFGSFTRAIERQLEGFAEMQCARVAIAAERCRVATGRWPATLDELVPRYLDAIPADPFAPGQALRWKRDADRFLVYSIARDGNDDGGQILRGARESDSPDCGFILLDPAARNQPPAPTTNPDTQSAP